MKQTSIKSFSTALAQIVTVGLCLTFPASVDLGETPAPEVEATSSQLEVLGEYHVAGQTLKVMDLGQVSDLTSRITLCGQGVLYSTRTDGTLWVNVKSGVGSWTKVTAGTQGTRIACDRRHLYALHTDGSLYHANTRSDGQLNTLNPEDSTVTQVWSNSFGGKTLAVPAGTDEIAGGMGNIYALVFNSATQVGTLYSSQLSNATSPAGYVQGAADSWVKLADNLGTNLATGAGSRAMFTAATTSLGYRKFNRAFGANPDETLYYNDRLLDGGNSWTSFPNAGQDIRSIAADDSNTMYALTQRSGHKHLVRFSFVESNCHDKRDNDSNGQIDAEDGRCRSRLAMEWCQGRTGGSYCIDRIESTYGYSHALVTCNPEWQPTIQAGRCMKDTLGHDYLKPARPTNEPFGSGHYCSVIKADGTWDFNFTGSKPCSILLWKHPGATIVRAGIYSTDGLNNVYVRCNNGTLLPAEGVGTAPLAAAYAGVGHTNNRCVFTVSPRAMRVFNAPFPTSAWAALIYGGRGYAVGHVFDHVPECVVGDPGCPCPDQDCPVPLAPFGNGDTGETAWLDNNGRKVTTYQKNQNAYDYIINEGTPLRSLGYGTVVSSRDLNLAPLLTGGTTYQGEIFIRYDVGSDPVYAETFIAYYAHVGRRVVITGQTVEPGQLIGYSGTTGASSDPHLHFALFRLSNTNGRSTAGDNAFGYHIPFPEITGNTDINFQAMPGAIDPYGWRAGGIDPMGYLWANAKSEISGVTGIGAWSPQMWQSSEVPPYPKR